LAATRATPKKAKSKVRRAVMSAKKKRAPNTAERRQVTEMPVETTVIDLIEEPAAGVVAVTDYESVRASTSPGGEPERGESIGPVGT
jgi:hypothetical protein